MPAFQRHSRSRAHVEYPGDVLDRLLDGVCPADDTPPQLQTLARILDAVRAPVAEHEVTGEARAADAFARALNAKQDSPIPRRRRFVLATLLGSKLATAAAAGALGFGGVAAAAYAGALPEPIQDFAHQTVGAPASEHNRSESGDANQQGEAAHADRPASDEAVGPDPNGPAKFGLCTAFADDVADRGKVDTHSVAFRALAEAAGGADKIGEFCADVIDLPSEAVPDQPGKPTDAPPTDAPPTEGPSTPAHPTGAPVDPPTRG